MSPSSTPQDESESVRLHKTMHFLKELAEVAASSTELQPILDWIVSRTSALLAADEGCLRLITKEAPGSMTLVRPAAHQLGSGSWPRAVAMSVTGFVVHHEGPVVTPDLLGDERFPGLRGCETRVRALLAVPLRVENRITGLLAVTQAEPGRRWTEDDVELLSIVAGSSAGAIEQARLRVEALAVQRLEADKQRLESEARRIERELDQARDAQMRLVPDGPLRLGAWEVAGCVTPARQVGGDSFDYFVVDGRRLGFSIGDVSGKGMPAALLMMTAQGYLRVFCCAGQRPLPEKLRLLNQSVTRSAQPGKFITLFYGELDPEDGVLRYVNAGHNYPLLRRSNGDLEPLVEGGLMLGFGDEVEFKEGETPMAPGDTLLLYSDGASEAMNAQMQDYGEDRLQEAWRRCGTLPPGECIAKLMAELEAFRAGAPQSDDITLVVLAAHVA
jgi:serine phosphatase RsbU (regulator of sigma subunit)